MDMMSTPGQSNWTLGPTAPQLAAQEIHIWRILLPLSSEASITAFQSSLSKEELLRLHQFHFNKDKQRYIAARGGLRNIIGHYLQKDPASICFDYTTFQKPFLKTKELFFNISHSENCILYALSQNPFIGIDVEYCHPHMDFLSTANICFSKKEYVQFLMLPLEQRALAFYRCWTRKEALLKAIGTGFYIDPNQIEVSFLSSEKAQLFTLYGKPQQESPWKLEEILSGPDYIASIATQEDYSHLCLWDWNEQL